MLELMSYIYCTYQLKEWNDQVQIISTFWATESKSWYLFWKTLSTKISTEKKEKHIFNLF